MSIPKMPKGYEMVCPDGKVRSYPGNYGDVASEARCYTRERNCCVEKGDPKEWAKPPCPQGKHTVRGER